MNTTDQWHFLEISWNADSGLEIHVDLDRVAYSRASKKPVDVQQTETRLCVGCLNAPKNITSGFQRTAANVIIDELLICYGSLDKLIELEFLQRGKTGL